MYGSKNTSLVSVKTDVLTLEPQSTLELIIWEANDDSFRRDIFGKALKASD